MSVSKLKTETWPCDKQLVVIIILIECYLLLSRSDMLPKKVFICSYHFDDNWFDASWKLQNELFCKDRPIKRHLVKCSVSSTFSCKELVMRESSKQRIDKRRNERKRIFFFFTSCFFFLLLTFLGMIFLT